MTLAKPAIVIPVFKRLYSLKTLLASIEKAELPSQEVPLVFRSHKGAAPEVLNYCEAFQWSYGAKTHIQDPEAIDLDENLRRCGDLTQVYDDIVILEDDSYVSPFFYSFAQQALAFCDKDPEIAQVSLYRYHFHPISGLPHHLLHDSASNFFAQKSSTRGQAFSKAQWAHFRDWLNDMPQPDDRMPAYIKAYGLTNWELQHNWYLIEQGRYSLMPKLSVVSNSGAVGTHHNSSLDSGYFQVPLQGVSQDYSFSGLLESSVVYDAFFEIHPKVFERLKLDDLEVDLGGHKPESLLQTKTVLTSKSCKEPIEGFGSGLKPVELNVIWHNKGTEINLCKAYNLVKDVNRERHQNAKQYFGEVVDIGLIDFIKLKWLKYVDRKRQKE